MTTWILILFIGQPIATTQVGGYKTLASCIDAGTEVVMSSKTFLGRDKLVVNYVCLEPK